MSDAIKSRRGKQPFKSNQSVAESTTARLRNKHRLAETSGRATPRRTLNKSGFCWLRLRPFESGGAVGLSGADRAADWAVAASKMMKTGQSDLQYSARYSNRPQTIQFYAFYGTKNQPSNGKSRDGRDHFTHFTDFTVNEKGVYVASACARPRSRPLGLIPTPLSRGVKSVKSVKPQEGEGWFSPPRCKTGCKIYGSRDSGVVA